MYTFKLYGVGGSWICDVSATQDRFVFFETCSVHYNCILIPSFVILDLLSQLDIAILELMKAFVCLFQHFPLWRDNCFVQ